MISILITLFAVVLIVGLIFYVCDALPVAEPLNRIAKIVAVVIGVLIIVMMLLSLAGYNTGFPLR